MYEKEGEEKMQKQIEKMNLKKIIKTFITFAYYLIFLFDFILLSLIFIDNQFFSAKTEEKKNLIDI